MRLRFKGALSLILPIGLLGLVTPAPADASNYGGVAYVQIIGSGLIGVQDSYTAGAPSGIPAGTDCGTPFNLEANPVYEQVTAQVSDADTLVFGTAFQCSGVEYWYFALQTGQDSFTKIRTLGISGEDPHTFYLWYNGTEWVAQIDNTIWSTYKDSSSTDLGEMVEITTADSGPPVIVSYDNAGIALRNASGWSYIGSSNSYPFCSGPPMGVEEHGSADNYLLGEDEGYSCPMGG